MSAAPGTMMAATETSMLGKSKLTCLSNVMVKFRWLFELQSRSSINAELMGMISVRMKADMEEDEKMSQQIGKNYETVSSVCYLKFYFFGQYLPQ